MLLIYCFIVLLFYRPRRVVIELSSDACCELKGFGASRNCKKNDDPHVIKTKLKSSQGSPNLRGGFGAHYSILTKTIQRLNHCK